MHNIRYGNRIPDNETEYQTWYRKSAGRPKEALNSPPSCREAGVSLCKKFHSYVRARRTGISVEPWPNFLQNIVHVSYKHVNCNTSTKEHFIPSFHVCEMNISLHLNTLLLHTHHEWPIVDELLYLDKEIKIQFYHKHGKPMVCKCCHTDLVEPILYCDFPWNKQFVMDKRV